MKFKCKNIKECGKSVSRFDAFDKVVGRAQYYEDLVPNDALFAKIKHSEIAHGFVKSIDKSLAKKVDGVVKILTCFDVPNHKHCTAGHPFQLNPTDRDVSDARLLNKHVRYYGDCVAVVIAETELAAIKAVNKLKVQYEELPFYLTPKEAMKKDAYRLHKDYPRNILAHIRNNTGNYDLAIKEKGLIKVEGCYKIPTVQHCHLEPFGCFAMMNKDRYIITSSTQIPHITKRLVSAALGEPISKIQIIKPYIGGGFGNKQDMLYEGLCAWCSSKVSGRCVRIDCSREETFNSNRVRHSMDIEIVTWINKKGYIKARKVKIYSRKGAYASHGSAITAKALISMNELYPCKNYCGDAYVVYTNTVPSGAMRGYGIPQATFAMESNIEDCARAINIDSLEFRHKNIMPIGHKNSFYGTKNYDDSLNECLKLGKKKFHYKKKLKEYSNDIGNIKRGVGVSTFWYNTGVYPISLEQSSCRMILNLDGTVTLQIGETEIGQGLGTVCAQMTADAIGLASYKDVNVLPKLDTDTTPACLGAYASRQTYMAGFAIANTAKTLKKHILKRVVKIVRKNPDKFLNIKKDKLILHKKFLDIKNGKIVDKKGDEIISLGDFAYASFFCKDDSDFITAEENVTINSNAYTFGCSFASVEVDVAACKVKINKILNVHDCGRVINPLLAKGQVHGGVSMSLGMGAYEEILHDKKTGKILNDNFLDYKIPSFEDYVDIDTAFIQNIEPTSPFGVKGLGEPPACSPACAIRNAVLNATGVAINNLPLNPRNLYVHFKEAGLLD